MSVVLVVVMGKTYVLVARNLNLDTLALTHILHDLTNLRRGLQGRATGEDLPMVEDGLWEGLAGGMGAEIGVEAEGLHDGEVGLDGEEGCSGTLLLAEDVATSAGEDTVDTAHSGLGDLDLDKEDGLEETGLGEESRGVEDTPSSWDELSTTTVNGVGVEGNVHDVKSARSHWLLGDWSFSGSPLETGDDGVLDFVEILDGLGLVNQQVGTGCIGTEAPDLTGVGDIPSIFVGEDTGTGLEIVTGGDLASLDHLGELLVERLSNHVQTVVLVRRLRQSSHAGLAGNSFTEVDGRVGDAEGNTSVVFLEILQANLQMQLTGTSNDVLTGFGDGSQHTRIRFRETLETFDEFWEILSVLDLDGTLDDRGDGELHDLQVVGGLTGGESTGLQQELIDTNQSEDITSWDIIDRIDLASHHEDGTLDGLDEKIILLAGSVVGTLDADLKTRSDGTSEDTTEGVESTLIRGWHHL